VPWVCIHQRRLVAFRDRARAESDNVLQRLKIPRRATITTNRYGPGMEHAPLVASTHPVWASAEVAAAARADQPGAVIRHVRQAAGLTLDQLGSLYGCSASTLSRIERGQPPVDQIGVRRRLAHLLGIPDELVGLAPARHAARVPQPPAQADTLPGGAHDGDRSPMRRRTLLTGAGVSAAALAGLTSSPATAADRQPASLDRLLLAPTLPAAVLPADRAATAVAGAAQAYRDARYSTLAAALPQLLASLHASRDAADGHRKESIAGLLSRAYAVASSLATKQGDDAIALTMADRARAEALAASDHAALTAATHVLAITMRRDGHHTGALNLLLGTAAQLDPADTDPAVLAAYGTMLCTAAYTSAQAGQAVNADTYLSEAASAADRIGDHQGAGVHPFTPTTVTMYRISVHTTLGDSGAALRHAASVDPSRLPTAERHSRYLVDTARAWHRHGRPDRAAHALLAAERHAPEDVARASVRDLVTTLLYAPTPTPAALRELANRIGVS
jgi:transcriptional regulator with XRE-family HTH domain